MFEVLKDNASHSSLRLKETGAVLVARVECHHRGCRAKLFSGSAMTREYIERRNEGYYVAGTRVSLENPWSASSAKVLRLSLFSSASLLSIPSPTFTEQLPFLSTIPRWSTNTLRGNRRCGNPLHGMRTLRLGVSCAQSSFINHPDRCREEKSYRFCFEIPPGFHTT
jgi:hypothetical protein